MAPVVDVLPAPCAERQGQGQEGGAGGGPGDQVENAAITRLRDRPGYSAAPTVSWHRPHPDEDPGQQPIPIASLHAASDPLYSAAREPGRGTKREVAWFTQGHLIHPREGYPPAISAAEGRRPHEQ
jgi:hypothetical protein